jgi:hypothetical protein
MPTHKTPLEPAEKAKRLKQSHKIQYQKHREQILKEMHQRYWEDEAYRQRIKDSNRQRYHENPAYAAKVRERARERYRIKKNNPPEELKSE